jgi:hypothetical protein
MSELPKSTKRSLLDHIADTQAMQFGFTVTLLDGDTYKADSGDFIFTDGLSIVYQTRRMYFPLTSIKSITIHNPGDNK